MNRPWEAAPGARVRRRLGKSAAELGYSKDLRTCPEIMELDSGDVAFIGQDVTDTLSPNLPDDINVGPGERIVVLPRGMVIAAKPDIPDA